MFTVLLIPDNGLVITDKSLVLLAKFPKIKIVHLLA